MVKTAEARPGLLVLVHCLGYPRWPGFIVDDSYVPQELTTRPKLGSLGRKGKLVPVIFINESSYLYISPSKLSVLTPQRCKEYLSRRKGAVSRDPVLRRAYELAMKYPVLEDCVRHWGLGADVSLNEGSSGSSGARSNMMDIKNIINEEDPGAPKGIEESVKVDNDDSDSEMIPDEKSGTKVRKIILNVPQETKRVRLSSILNHSGSTTSSTTNTDNNVGVKEEPGDFDWDAVKRHEEPVSWGSSQTAVSSEHDAEETSLRTPDNGGEVKLKSETKHLSLIPPKLAPKYPPRVSKLPQASLQKIACKDLPTAQFPLDEDYWFYYDKRASESMYRLGPDDVDVTINNILASLPGTKIPEELTQNLKELYNLRLEKIVPIVERYKNFFKGPNCEFEELIVAGGATVARVKFLRKHLAQYRRAGRKVRSTLWQEKHPAMGSKSNIRHVSDLLSLDEDVVQEIENIVKHVAESLDLTLYGKVNTIRRQKRISKTQTWNRKPMVIKNRIIGVMKRILWDVFEFDGSIVNLIMRRVARLTGHYANYCLQNKARKEIARPRHSRVAKSLAVVDTKAQEPDEMTEVFNHFQSGRMSEPPVLSDKERLGRRGIFGPLERSPGCGRYY